MSKNPRVEDISQPTEQLTEVRTEDLIPIEGSPGDPETLAEPKELSPEVKAQIEASLDGTAVLAIPKPATLEEEEALVGKFLQGLKKLFSKTDNWTFLQPLLLSVHHCAKCQTCSAACHVFEASGHNEVYRPTYRSEVIRRIIFKYLKPGGKLFAKWTHGDIDLNWKTIARLAELAYRCNLCRRCAQTCPLGVDNALLAREIRKVFSQEMGITAKELHDRGSVLQIATGSSTGMTPRVLKDNMEFIDEEMSDLTGLQVETPMDKEGADILLIHNAGEILAWPENPGAFAIILNAAGVSWTMSSDLMGYDNINYGLFYDDAQFARVVVGQTEAARKLKVNRIVLGECGHAHKALTVTAERVLPPELRIPRESAFPLLEQIVFGGKIEFDSKRNDFPVTLHDPCNIVRSMGIVEPQRRILRELCPQFREMTPHGVHNYCCGGGSGFAIMSSNNFDEWRFRVSGRKKMQQIMEAFADELDPSIKKYVCAPCSNCKGQIRDMFAYYDVWEKHSLMYGGLSELIVNAMVDIKQPFLEWEWH